MRQIEQQLLVRGLTCLLLYPGIGSPAQIPQSFHFTTSVEFDILTDTL